MTLIPLCSVQRSPAGANAAHSRCDSGNGRGAWPSVDSGDTLGHPRSEGRRESATMDNPEGGKFAAEGAECTPCASGPNTNSRLDKKGEKVESLAKSNKI